jgi:hypothetical protein
VGGSFDPVLLVIRARSRERAQVVSYRGEVPRHGTSTTGHASRDIASTLLLMFMDRRPMVLEGRRGTGRKEGGYPGLYLSLLSKEHLKLLLINGSVDP